MKISLFQVLKIISEEIYSLKNDAEIYYEEQIFDMYNRCQVFIEQLYNLQEKIIMEAKNDKNK